MELLSTTLPVYSSEAFVDREQEVELTKVIARQISRASIDGQQMSGSSDPPQIVVFRGERGSGKTWLALHLQRTVLPSIPNVMPLLINFFPPLVQQTPQANEWFADTLPDAEPLESEQLTQLTQRIVEWVAGRVGATTVPNASLRELTNWLVRDVEQLFHERVLALILDSVYEVSWDLLKELETYLLAPLAALPRVLIVMTGRGRPYPWESPYLRADVAEDQLHPFDTEQVERQLYYQKPEAVPQAARIRTLGGGHPLSNFLLAQKSNPADSLEQAAEALLAVVQSKERQRHARAYFEALCLLDGFREDEIPPMLAAYFDDPQYETWTPPQTREERDGLLETHMMRWEGGRFIIDEPLRLVLESLVKAQPELWQRLHCRAYRLYEEWGRRFLKWRTYYEQRAARHAAALQLAGFDIQACADSSQAPPEYVSATGAGRSGQHA
jgi:hypothetical protein